MALSFFLSTHSNNSTIDTASSLNGMNHGTETAGSVSFLFGNDTNEDGGMDAFGGKDLFGTPDLSNVNESFFANAGEAETVGSVAYGAETAGSVACANVGGGASASVGADSGSSGGGGGFASVC